MIFKQLKSRRDFLRAGCRTISTLGAAAAFGQAGLVSARAQGVSDYKALVCIFLFGGNDGNNLLVPTDNATYKTYQTIRQNLALAQGALVPLGGSNFGLHPSLAPIAPFFTAPAGGKTSRLAVVANVGTLVNKVTRGSGGNLLGPLPVNLFSHSDQTSEWQNAVPQGGATTGWEGRLADKIFSSTPAFPPSIGVGGSALQLVGMNQGTQPAAITLNGFSLLAPSTDPGSAALTNMLSIMGGPTLVQAAETSLTNAIGVAKAVDNAVNNSANLGVTFPNSDIGTQLGQVAKIIQVRASLGATRQIFFCSQGGFDTHSDQLPQQAQLLGNLAAAMASFDQAMQSLGEVGNVTTFTQSEFSRTFQPNGNAGSDHAWGSNHLVMGGAVQGGKIYGTFPTLALNTTDDSGDRGNWIPTSSTDQYAGALAKWFGLAGGTDTAYVFPNLGNFGGPLGFMG